VNRNIFPENGRLLHALVAVSPQSNVNSYPKRHKEYTHSHVNVGASSHPVWGRGWRGSFTLYLDASAGLMIDDQESRLGVVRPTFGGTGRVRPNL